MAYTAGDTILDDEYNVFVTGSSDGTATHTTANVNSVWGTGADTKGYGQSGALASVNAGTGITATQWNNLLTRLETIGAHQGTTVTDYTTLTTADPIAAFATLSSNVSSIYTNRFNCAAVAA